LVGKIFISLLDLDYHLMVTVSIPVIPQVKIPHISVVIPVYKAEGNLQNLAERLVSTITQITLAYEIILVEDGSPDNTWETILNLCKKYSNIKGIKLSRNFGQHCAIAAGLEHSTGEWIVIMDCDLQHPPEEIHKLYSKAMENYEIVFGARRYRNDLFLKKFLSYCFYKLLFLLTDFEIDPSTSNFGIYHRRVIKSVNDMHEKLRWYPAMIRWVGFRYTTVNISHASRFSGYSSYSFRKLIHLAIDIICLSSDKPLRLTIKCGLCISTIAFLFAVYTLFRIMFMSETPPLGWLSLIISIWFFFGLVIFFLGTIGLYIARIFNEVRARPVYIIDHSVNFKG